MRRFFERVYTRSRTLLLISVNEAIWSSIYTRSIQPPLIARTLPESPWNKVQHRSLNVFTRRLDPSASVVSMLRGKKTGRASMRQQIEAAKNGNGLLFRSRDLLYWLLEDLFILWLRWWVYFSIFQCLFQCLTKLLKHQKSNCSWTFLILYLYIKIEFSLKIFYSFLDALIKM